MLSLCFLTFLLFVPDVTVQSCNPAVLDYIVRDEKGQVLSDADLQAVFSVLPKVIGNAGVATSEVSFAPDKLTYYWPESVEFPKGNKLTALEFANASTCTLHLEDLTLTYHGKKMRLIFNVDIARGQKDRRPVVDSLTFQEGTFKLDLEGWSRAEDKLIPASRWKKLKQN